MSHLEAMHLEAVRLEAVRLGLEAVRLGLVAPEVLADPGPAQGWAADR